MKNVTTVIRIEHSVDDKGLFSSTECRIYEYAELEDLIQRHNEKFPLPYLDKGLDGTILENEFCGFKSIEQLQSWVYPDEMKFLIDKGFRVLLIDVENVRVGEFQILFQKELILQTKDITNLFI